VRQGSHPRPVGLHGHDLGSCRRCAAGAALGEARAIGRHSSACRFSRWRGRGRYPRKKLCRGRVAGRFQLLERPVELVRARARPFVQAATQPVALLELAAPERVHDETERVCGLGQAAQQEVVPGLGVVGWVDRSQAFEVLDQEGLGLLEEIDRRRDPLGPLRQERTKVFPQRVEPGLVLVVREFRSGRPGRRSRGEQLEREETHDDDGCGDRSGHEPPPSSRSAGCRRGLRPRGDGLLRHPRLGAGEGPRRSRGGWSEQHRRWGGTLPGHARGLECIPSRPAEILAGGVALLLGLGHGPGQDVVQARREVRPDGGEFRRRIGHVGEQHAHVAVCGTGPPPSSTRRVRTPGSTRRSGRRSAAPRSVREQRSQSFPRTARPP
jgi:hypothetical protein